MTAVLEDAKEFAIEEWGTLNTAASPTKLPAGHSPNHQNVWVDEKPGSVVTAHGYRFLGQNPSGNPTTLLVDFFKTSDGSSQLVLSDNVTVWHTTDFVNYTQIVTGLSGFFQLRGMVIRDKLWLTNGSDDVMTWDGTTLVRLGGSGGTPDVPAGKYIAYHDERVWLYGISDAPSAARFTALTDAAGTEIAPDNIAAWPTDNEIQISEGDADQGTGIFLYRGYLYCSKQYSIYRIVGYDEYTYTRVKTRASTGTRFQESIQIKDNLIHFIGVDGFYVFDGEEAQRISDPIDPSNPASGVFAFRNLQQPLLNNAFWNVTESADLAAGTVPNNLSTGDDKLTLIPADDTQADFNSGTHDDTTANDNPGNLQLALVEIGQPGALISLGKNAFLDQSGGLSVIGVNSSINDGATSPVVGFGSNFNTQNNAVWIIDMGSETPVGKVVLKNFLANAGFSLCEIEVNVGAYQAPGATNGSWVNAFQFFPPQSAVPADWDIPFATVRCIQVRLFVSMSAGQATLGEMEVYRGGFEPDGTFLSAPIDYGAAPASFGHLTAIIAANGEAYQFFTQSSSDGITWGIEVDVANNALIGSTLRQYLRWGVNLFSSTGLATPVIDKVYVGGTYLSAIHNTGGNILQWGGFTSERNELGQTILYYFRAASTSPGLSSASWTVIVPGAVPNTDIANIFFQVRIELSTSDAARAPFVDSFTVNWVLSTTSGAAVLQNVASFVWLNRYWLAAATLGASENDIVVVLGKSTAKNPWHQKDWSLLSFCRFINVFVGGSSVDGSLFELESSYSKAGEAMDSFYETRDFSNSELQMKGRELLITCDRMGPYDLDLGWSTDGGETYQEVSVDLTQDDGASMSFTKKFNINFMGEKVRFRVRSNAVDKPFSVDGLRLYFRQTLQRGTLGS